MTALALTAILAILGAQPLAAGDRVLEDGTVYRPFDYELLAKITARNTEKRESYGKYTYDPETWLPVPEKKPRQPKPNHRDDSAVRQARMQRAALRRQRSQAGYNFNPLPAYTFRKPCPWAFISIPALGY